VLHGIAGRSPWATTNAHVRGAGYFSYSNPSASFLALVIDHDKPTNMLRPPGMNVVESINSGESVTTAN
jgi:hypothetical protein